MKCLVLTPKTVRLARLAGKNELDALATKYRRALQQGHSEAATAAAHALHAAVIAPLHLDDAATRDVVVVPDGQLHAVAFERLLAVGGRPVSTVTIVPSATTLALLRRPGLSRPTERAVLAVGGVPYGEMPGAHQAVPASPLSFHDASMPPKLSGLPGTADEARSVAAILGGRSTVLIGNAATEARLKAERLGGYDVLHLAAHGVADAKFPERAAVVLLGDATCRRVCPRSHSGTTLTSTCSAAIEPRNA